MESCSQSLATESFSHSWLVTKTPTFDECFISSPRDTDFNFDPLISRTSSFNLVHADEIFCNGHIMPIFVDRSRNEENPNAPSSIPASSISSRNFVFQEDGVNYFYYFKNWRKSSKKIVTKCFSVLKPLWQKIGCRRKSVRVDDIDRKVWEVQSLGAAASGQVSPRKFDEKIDYRRLRKAKSLCNFPEEYVTQIPYYSAYVYGDIEGSILEAVLHCKRSIEN